MNGNQVAILILAVLLSSTVGLTIYFTTSTHCNASTVKVRNNMGVMVPDDPTQPPKWPDIPFVPPFIPPVLP